MGGFGGLGGLQHVLDPKKLGNFFTTGEQGGLPTGGAQPGSPDFLSQFFSPGAFGPLAASIISGIQGNAIKGSMEDAIAQANAANEARFEQALNLSQGSRAAAGDQFSQAEEFLRNSLGRTNQLYGKARESIGTLGAEARRGALERGEQREAADLASARARGLGNTTVVDATQNRSREQTDRNLRDIDERLGAVQSGLLERQAQQIGQQRGDVADFMFGAARAEHGMAQDEIDLLERKQDVARTNEMLALLESARSVSPSDSASQIRGSLSGALEGSPGGFGAGAGQVGGFGGGGGQGGNQAATIGAGIGGIAASLIPGLGPFAAPIGTAAGGFLGDIFGGIFG